MTEEVSIDSITEETIQTIAQGVAGAYPLPPTAANELAMDTEYFTRELIALALTFKSHCKATSLGPEHVSSALRILTGSIPLGDAEGGRPFRQVPNCNGVYVVDDPVLALAPIRNTPLPPISHQRAPSATWALNPSWRSNTPAPTSLAAVVRAALSSANALEHAERTLSESPTAGIYSSALARKLAMETDSVLRPDADPDAGPRLARILVMTRALLVNPAPGVSSATSLAVLARITLSALLSPHGRPATSAAKDDPVENGCSDASRTLAHLLVAAAPYPPIRARVLTTLIAALTDARSTLRVVYGAICGLVVAGRGPCELLLAPHLPALAAALGRVLHAAQKLGIDHPESVDARRLVAAIAELAAEALDEPDQGQIMK